MTRGRKKDMTIPPTRSLVQQRDYRARKAHYVAELEERCKRAEDENRQLRQELELARANMSVPFLYNPLAAEMSAELLHSLSQASESLVKFQDFARRHPLSNEGASTSRLDTVRFPPLQEPMRATPHLPPILPPIPSMRQSNGHAHVSSQHRNSHHSPRDGLGRKRFCREDSPSPPPDEVVKNGEYGLRSYPHPHRSSSSESDCCGGYFDCDGLCEDGSTQASAVNSNERTTSRIHSFSPSHTSSSGDR